MNGEAFGREITADKNYPSRPNGLLAESQRFGDHNWTITKEKSEEILSHRPPG